MESQSGTPAPARRPGTHPLLLVAGIAIILFCAVGIAAIMGWIPTSGSSETQKQAAAGPSAATQPTAGPARSTAKTEAPAHKPAVQVATAKCLDCGVVESVREVDTPGKTSGLGAVAGGVVGGVVGNQMGGGRGRDVMTVVGAVGGAVAGNEIEKRVKATKSWEIAVRMEDGSLRTVQETAQPSWRAGDKVRIVDGKLQARS